MLWLSGVVVDRTFTTGGVDVRAHLFVDHRHVNVSICVLNFHGLFQPRKYFKSDIFLIYGIVNVNIMRGLLVRLSFARYTTP